MTRRYAYTPKQSFLLFIALLTLLLAVIAPIEAQGTSDIPDDAVIIEITGVVSFSEAGDFMVDGIVIAPEGIRPQDYSTGDTITVRGILQLDNSLVAVRVDDDPVACDPEIDDCDEHPIAAIIIDQFDINSDVVQTWIDDGFSYADIIRILVLAEALDGEISVDDLFDQLAGSNWGAVMKDYDVHPNTLAPGLVISARNRPDHAGPPNNDDDANNAPGNNGQGNNGNNGQGNNGNNGQGDNGNNGQGNNGNNGQGNNGNGRR